MKRHAPAPLPVVTAGLVASILAVYGMELAGPDAVGLCYRFGFVSAHPSLATALTSLVLHDPSTFVHVGGNVAFLIVFGSVVERAIGSLRFAVLFVAGGLAGAGLHLVVDPSSTTALVGCSGSLFAVLGVAAVLFGAPMLGFVGVLALTNIAHAFFGGGGEVSFGCHLGGLFAGFLFVALARVRGGAQALAPV